VSKEGALRRLEGAFRDWFWETHKDMPNIGIVVISISTDGADIQYMGQEPATKLDWPYFFRGVCEHLAAGHYDIEEGASVDFNHRA